MAYDPQIALIHSLSAQLGAMAGVEPRVIYDDGIAHIEVEVTDDLLRRWERAIPVLSRGDAFGLTDTETGQIAWLRISRDGNH
ncbi:hypothetical protein GCM10009864_71070 [Streptomyces lunalinharesii]|uniref:Uncharacterized protein n=1 Tax=Streptomyces lunalinharesii TaxID=333384 RepID=A0ABN3SVP4_9ACTN